MQREPEPKSDTVGLAYTVPFCLCCVQQLGFFLVRLPLHDSRNSCLANMEQLTSLDLSLVARCNHANNLGLLVLIELWSAATNLAVRSSSRQAKHGALSDD